MSGTAANILTNNELYQQEEVSENVDDYMDNPDNNENYDVGLDEDQKDEEEFVIDQAEQNKKFNDLLFCV